MAFSLGAWVKSHTHPFTSAPGGQASNQPPTIAYHFEMADQAVTTTPVAQFPTGVSYGRAVVSQKGWGSGSGTVGPTYELQIAYDSGFTSQVRTIGSKITLRTGDNQTFLLEGPVPDAQTYTFGRVKLTLSGTDVITFDYVLDTIPGI